MRIEGGGRRPRRNFDSDSRRCHFERSREISIAVRKSARMRYSINAVLVLRFSAVLYLLLTMVQERSLHFGRDDDTRNSLFPKAAPSYFLRRTTKSDFIVGRQYFKTTV